MKKRVVAKITALALSAAMLFPASAMAVEPGGVKNQLR